MRNIVRVVLVLSLLSGGLLAALPATAQEYHVVGGRPASAGAYPAMAALIDTEFGQFCGGTLVHPEWVVTAAHCFFDARTGGSSVPPGQVEIALDTTDWTVGGERIGVDQIVLHPEYDDFGTVNDIALLRLSQPAVTPPTPLAQDPAQYEAGRPAVGTGFGATTPFGENPSQFLLEADLPIVSDAECGAFYDLVPDRHVCAGAPGQSPEAPGPDTCQGDSGGPLWGDRGDGVLSLVGITSFGNLCGVEAPGVYTEVITYLGWVAGTIDGSIPPGIPVDPTVPSLPSGAASDPVRIAADPAGTSDPVRQAVAISQQTFFEGGAPYGVIATSTRFPDALGGSALAYGIAPLLFSGPEGSLVPEVLVELQRAVQPGAPVFVLGGVAAVPALVDAQLQELGFEVRRLAGSGREATAAAVAREVVGRFGGVPQDSVIVATGGNWPDAVTVGEIGSFWGVPILLTPTDQLNGETAAALAELDPGQVLVAGGEAAISPAVVTGIEGITGAGSVTRLAGSTRFGTAAAVTQYDIQELYGQFPPSYLIAVNLRRDADAFAHVLAASMLTGQFAGVYVPVEGDGGTEVPQEVRDGICGLDLPVIVAGGTDLVSDAAVSSIQQASGGADCASVRALQLGDAISASLTDALPTRSYTVQATAGDVLRLRMDAVDTGGDLLDPLVTLIGPDGAAVASNDDSPEGGTLNSLLEVAVPATGVYEILAGSFDDVRGSFRLSVDSAAVVTDAGTLTEDLFEVIYPLTAEAGVRVVVEMRAVDQIDPLLILLDADGVEIDFDDDGGAFPNARLSFVAPGGPIQVVATTFDGIGGAYTLAVFAPEGGVTFG